MHVSRLTAPTMELTKFRPFIFALLLGGVGALLNTLTLPFLPQVELIFGNAAFIIVAMRLKPQYALFSALITTLPLYYAWGHPFGFITFGLEALIVSYARSKGIYVLFADIAYWLCIGMPLTLAVLWLASPARSEYWFFITLKQGINAALYTSLATLVAFFLGRRTIFGWQHQPATQRGLRTQLIHSIVLITTFTLISSALFMSRNIFMNAQKYVDSTLVNTANRFSEMTFLFIENQQNVLKMTSKWLSNQSETHYQHTLNQVHSSHPGFYSMLIADINSKVSYSSPTSLVNELTGDNQFIHDRKYFNEAINQQDLYTSGIFKGRGLGDIPLVAISMPIFNEGLPVGIVQGTIDVSKISNISKMTFGREEVKIIVTDHADNVVYASEELNLAPVSPFTFAQVNHTNALPLLTINSSVTEYAYQVKTLRTGWKVYSLIDYQVIIADVEHEYLIIFINLVITLLIAALMAGLFGTRLTRSINFIIRQINKYDEKNNSDFQPISVDASIETRQLYEEFKANKRAMAEYQQQLEEKVELRTKELNSANEKLQLLALFDGLTKVHNRQYLSQNFDYIQKSAQRNTALMAVVMLDLDHFKKLNDKHGHLAGDDSLVTVAKLISEEFSRETDTVIRYGGEEFLILVPYVTVAALKQKLEHLRVKIAEQVMVDANHCPFSVTASFGALIADADFSDDVTKWIKHADECLYQAKNAGRNQVVIKDKISRADNLP